jgi:hypothetical protein
LLFTALYASTRRGGTEDDNTTAKRDTGFSDKIPSLAILITVRSSPSPKPKLSAKECHCQIN